MKTLLLSITGIFIIFILTLSFPVSFGLGTGSIAKPVVTSTPLKVFKEGISVKDIVCTEGLQLIIKAEDGSPACVKPTTAQKLIERGWAANMADNADNETIKQTVNHKFPHPPDGFGCGMWSNATGWVKGNCVSPNIPHP